MRLTTPEISWHGKEPLFSLDFSPSTKFKRLVSSGADSNIRMWSVQDDKEHGSRVEFIANLSRHTKAVNVVRFSPKGNMLASGGDDCYVIIWKLNDNEIVDSVSQLGSMNSVDIENKESWQVTKMLRGHIEDVYDLAWSPTASQLMSGSVDNSVIIWDTYKGDKLRILKDHRQYVQGVSWDPCGSYVVSYSCDRTCRIYNTSNYRCCYNINKATLPSKPEAGGQNGKQIKIFHDETLPSFFRRLTFSPDGLLLIVPGGKFEVNEKTINTTYVFTKASMNKPVMYFPASKKPTIAVRCCPILFQLRNTANNPGENTKSVFKLPYRMVVAVASLDSVVLYDTQQSVPFGFLSNMHYASLTDIAWSSDGTILAISSRDGYCSLVSFEVNELGIPYSQTASEVIEKTAVQCSPSSQTATKPKSKTPESVKSERTPPKIETLSIKNFVTINKQTKPDETSSELKLSQTIQDGGQSTTEAAPVRRFSFETIPTSTGTKPSPCTNSPLSTVPKASVSMATKARRVNFTTLQPVKSQISTQSLNTNSSNPTNEQSAIKFSKKPDTTFPQQPRRVGFVTIEPAKNSTISSASHVRASNVSSEAANVSVSQEGVKCGGIASGQQSRRVEFVTLKPAENAAASVSKNIPQTQASTTNTNGSSPPIIVEKSTGCASLTQPTPRRVELVTISQRSPIHTTSTTHASGSSSPATNDEDKGYTSSCQPPPRQVELVTIPQRSPIHTTSITPPSESSPPTTNDGGKEFTSPCQPPPRQVEFVTVEQKQTIPQGNPGHSASTIHGSSPSVASEAGKACTPSRQSPPPPVGLISIQPSLSGKEKSPEDVSLRESPKSSHCTNQDTDVSSTAGEVQNSVARQGKPPVPLEPQVIIINE